MTASDRVAKLLALSRAEIGLLLESQLALLAAQMTCFFRPVGKLVSADTRRSEPMREIGLAERRKAAAIGLAVVRVSRHGLFRPSCLVRALAARSLLRSHGIHGSELRLGFRVQGGPFLAHAWVELQGCVVGDSLEQIRGLVPATELRLIEQ